MTLIRWKPRRSMSTLGDLIGIQDEMNRLFDMTLGQRPFESMGLFEGDWTPAIDVFEDESKIVVKAELPGMTHEDVDVSILGETLTIKGEKKKEEEKKEKNYHRLERAYGSFQRSVTLPPSVTSDKAKASFENGILEIEMPKKEEAKPKQIKVDIK
jgi:HSP20 family protein